MNTISIQPVALPPRHADFLIYFLRVRGDITALMDDLKLSASEVLEFLASPTLAAFLNSALANLHSLRLIIAGHAESTAAHHLTDVCAQYARKPDVLEKLRLAATALARLSQSARRTPISSGRAARSMTERATTPSTSTPNVPIADPPAVDRSGQQPDTPAPTARKPTTPRRPPPCTSARSIIDAAVRTSAAPPLHAL